MVHLFVNPLVLFSIYANGRNLGRFIRQ